MQVKKGQHDTGRETSMRGRDYHGRGKESECEGARHDATKDGAYKGRSIMVLAERLHVTVDRYGAWQGIHARKTLHCTVKLGTCREGLPQ